MLKYVLSFVAGCATVIAVLIVAAIVSSHRMMSSVAKSAAAPVTTTVAIRVTENPDRLRVANDASAVLDQISNLAEADKEKIRDGIASGLVTEIELQNDSGGDYNTVTIPVHPKGFIIRGSSHAHFGPALFRLDAVKKPEAGTSDQRP